MKPRTIDKILKIAEFAKRKGLTVRQVQHRLNLGQLHPMPSKIGYTFVFTGDEQIIVPPRPKPTGRPKGTTAEFMAKKRKMKKIKK